MSTKLSRSEMKELLRLAHRSDNIVSHNNVSPASDALNYSFDTESCVMRIDPSNIVARQIDADLAAILI